MKDQITSCTVVFVLITALASAESVDMSDWKDPIDRDESIDQTIISTEVSRTDGGLYQYTYRVESSADNTGRILGLDIDLACDLEFDEVDLPEPTAELLPDLSPERHVPAVLFARGAIGISAIKTGQWFLSLSPGEIAEGIRMVSPAPPGLRTATIDPSMDTYGWRYDLYEPGDPRIKWINDFTVRMEVIGPACRIDEEPEIAFLGAAEEPFGMNKLLAYASPISDQLEADGNSLELILFYDERIDPGTFKARLNGEDVSAAFSPEPGTHERVTVSGKLGRTTTSFASRCWARPMTRPEAIPSSKRSTMMCSR